LQYKKKVRPVKAYWLAGYWRKESTGASPLSPVNRDEAPVL